MWKFHFLYLPGWFCTFIRDEVWVWFKNNQTIHTLSLLSWVRDSSEKSVYLYKLSIYLRFIPKEALSSYIYLFKNIAEKIKGSCKRVKHQMFFFITDILTKKRLPDTKNITKFIHRWCSNIKKINKNTRKGTKIGLSLYSRVVPISVLLSWSC